MYHKHARDKSSDLLYINYHTAEMWSATKIFVVCAVQLMGDPACSVLHFHTTAINPRTEVQLAPTLYGV
jgi:hypothetical protein